MAQQVKMIDTKFDYLSSIPGSHMVGGETSSLKLFSEHHMCTEACVYTTHTR